MDGEIDKFLMYLAVERGLSKAYQSSVSQSLDALRQWAADTAHPLQDIGTEELAHFVAKRKDESLGNSSLRILVVHLKVFFRYLSSKGLVVADVAEPLIAPKIEGYLPDTVSVELLTSLLESIDTMKWLGKRDRALLDLFYA